MNLRALAVLISAFGAASSFGVGSAQTTQSGPTAQAQYSLVISSKQAAGAKAGSEIKLEIIQCNLSSHAIRSFQVTKVRSEAARYYQTFVRDEKGNLATETKYGRRIRTGKDDPGEKTLLVGSAVPRDLEPGELKADKIILNELYELGRPGVYTVQVQGLDDAGKTVKSNVIALTLTE